MRRSGSWGHGHNYAEQRAHHPWFAATRAKSGITQGRKEVQLNTYTGHEMDVTGVGDVVVGGYEEAGIRGPPGLTTQPSRQTSSGPHGVQSRSTTGFGAAKALFGRVSTGAVASANDDTDSPRTVARTRALVNLNMGVWPLL
jgi:hypothetical protein